jgi:hypothetical protein
MQNGQHILPMVELITQSRMAIDDLVDAVGRATIETVLQLSAEQVAGPPQQGQQREGEIIWHGQQEGSVYLTARRCGDFLLNLESEAQLETELDHAAPSGTGYRPEVLGRLSRR